MTADIGSKQQRGATLLVAIVLLLVITALAISSLRGVTLESRITANLKQEKTLMSAAEAGLRIGENSISNSTPPTVVKPCVNTGTTTVCMPWQLSNITASSNIDTPSYFNAANASNVATVATGYDSKIQWYVVQLGKLGGISVNNCGASNGGVIYYEVNACASSVLCTSDTVTRRVILRSVVARNYSCS